MTHGRGCGLGNLHAARAWFVNVVEMCWVTLAFVLLLLLLNVYTHAYVAAQMECLSVAYWFFREGKGYCLRVGPLSLRCAFCTMNIIVAWKSPTWLWSDMHILNVVFNDTGVVLIFDCLMPFVDARGLRWSVIWGMRFPRTVFCTRICFGWCVAITYSHHHHHLYVHLMFLDLKSGETTRWI